MTADNIVVLDNLFDPEQCMQLYNNVLDQPIWWHGRRSRLDDDGEYPFWGRRFDPRFLPDPIPALVSSIRTRAVAAGFEALATHDIYRVEGTADVVGGGGYPHSDHTSPEAMSLLYFANCDWDPSWSGETKFFDTQGEEILRAVLPRPGRGVLFPSRMVHCASPTSRTFKGLRISLSFIFLPAEVDERPPTERWHPGATVTLSPQIELVEPLVETDVSYVYVVSGDAVLAKLELQGGAGGTGNSLYQVLRATSRSLKNNVEQLMAATGLTHEQLVACLMALENKGIIEAP